ncbi:MAG TPA: VOC family protein [Verrucomicrobiae bacterium]|nr:VOC family protein [Verrucomicrobiae bacterium]
MELVVTSLDHLVLNVSDVEVSAAWYQRVLGMRREDFTPAGSSSARTSVKFGKQKINLRPASASPDAWLTARSVATGSADLCFLSTSVPDEVVAHLHALDIPIEKGPVERTGAQGTLLSVYCRDPDGNLIEIASYTT